MKYLYLLVWLFVLTGCIEQKIETPPLPPKCFNIVELKSNVSPSPILIDKCTGETWTILRESDELSKGQTAASYTYKWFRIERYAVENSVAGR
jgi:hypothetical protein